MKKQEENSKYKKNKENTEKCSRPQGPSAPPYYREQVTASVAV